MHFACLVSPALLALTGLSAPATLQDDPRFVARRQIARPLRLEVRESLLAELPAGMDPETVTVSRNGRHIAYVQASGAGEAVVLDGTPGKVYPDIAEGTLRFSANGERLLYIASVGGKDARMMATSVQTGRFHSFVTAPGGVQVVVDGKEQAQYDGVDVASLVFSADGARQAYVARQGDRWLVVVDGQEEGAELEDVAPFLDAPTLHFSPDGRRLAYVGVRREPETASLRWFVVDNRLKGPEYERIGSCPLAFSPDSQHLAYVAVRGGKGLAVRDGVEGKAYDDIVWHTGIEPEFRFSPDSKRLVYVARLGKTFRLVVDGVEGREHTAIAGLTFSPDSRRVAYLTGRKQPAPDALTEMSVVMDGVSGREYFQIQPPVYFSPDSRRSAFIHLPAPTRALGKRAEVVVDGRSGPVYQDILPPLVFSPDSRHIAYIAYDRAGRVIPVVDGVDGPAYDAFSEASPLYFESERRLVAVARRGARVLRLELEVKE